MNLDHDFFPVSKLSEDQKKERSSPKKEHFFSPNSDEDQKKVFTKKAKLFSRILVRPALRCTRVKLLGEGCRCRSYSNCWGYTVKLLGGDTSTYPPPGFGILVGTVIYVKFDT